jgi:hypothetical protein
MSILFFVLLVNNEAHAVCMVLSKKWLGHQGEYFCMWHGETAKLFCVLHAQLIDALFPFQLVSADNLLNEYWLVSPWLN